MSKRKQIKLIITVVVAILATIGYLINQYGQNANGVAGEGDIKESVADAKYSYHFIDVGQGDATLILSEKAAVLVDTGPSDHKESTKNYIGKYTERIDYMILTHPHEDHIGGAAYIIDTYDVENIIMPDAASSSVTFEKMLDAIERRDCNVIEAEQGNVYEAGDIKIEIFGPAVEYEDDLNNISVIAKITTDQMSALFTGDAEKTAEDALLKDYSVFELNCDIFQAGHHGSITSNSEKLLNEIKAEVAVISCDKNNTYGHPHHEVLERFNKFGLEVFRTDTMGDIVVVTDGKNYEVIESYT